MATAVNWNNVSMLTPGMKNLGNQFNARWPSRDGASDGAVGDFAHQQGTSGHNPDDTSYDNAEWDSDSDSKSEIRAIDVDKDLGGDVSMQEVINHMRKLPNLNTVIRYMIFNGKIYHERNNFAPQVYTGSNYHDKHAHFSGAWSNSADENTRFDFRFDELGDDMALSTEDKKFFTDTIRAEINKDNIRRWNNGSEVPITDTDNGYVTLPTALSFIQRESQWTRGVGVPAILSALATVGAKVDLDPSEIEAIKNALDVPTAEENAEAVVAHLGGVPTQELADALRSVLSDQQREDLAAALLA